MRWLAALLALLATPAAAQDAPAWAGAWEGRVGTFPVRLCIDSWGDQPARGAYYYLSQLEPIALSEEDGEGGELGLGGDGDGGNDLYDRAVAVVTRDGKASTSYIQRRLQIGYNRAATLMERMEAEGIVGQPNHAGKREILIPEDGENRF